MSINPRITVILHDLIMVVLAWSLASLFRYDFPLDSANWIAFLKPLPFVALAQGVVLWWAGVYRGVWRFASIPDLWNIIRAVVVGMLAVSLTLFLATRMEGIPRSALLLYPLFLIFLLSAPRLTYRMWKDHSFGVDSGNRERVLIIGAGRSGELLARDMLHDNGYLPVGFLDDKERLKGTHVHGIPVLGTIDELARIVAYKKIDVIVIAMPSANSAQMRRVVGLCEQTEIPFRTLPRLQDLVSGQASLKELREVAIDDLLGREPVSLDWQRIRVGLAGKRVLVTGAGGSIGAELCRQVARLGVATLVLYEHSEYNLYTVEMELRQEFPELVLYGFLGDVCDEVAVEHIMDLHRPEVLFHAAAYKHVPILEAQTREAVRNNVLGTKVVALAADKHHCNTFVMISTDKAVNPTSVMGTTKRIAEIFCQNLNQRSSTHFITVRFGNVLGSAGSVVPLFQKQISAGGPVTVTHPQITRFFMTIPEACQLIMQSAAMGRGGEIYVLDMGEPVGITYLAEQMIRLAGKVPGEDIEIIYTGLRPGEKLYEELFHAQEDLTKTDHKKILLAQCREMDWKFLNAVITEMEQACTAYDEAKIREQLKQLVPELSEAETSGSDNVVNLNRRNT
ncbi:MAG TPA: nucleoside-diphosphate sugar epimerase/dehydratase [Gammaproteobacteria bacterium]|nr:nucleoside-diphosphate sugar epimerase/dehydratase [Gammaproteobacteria bacterium]